MQSSRVNAGRQQHRDVQQQNDSPPDYQSDHRTEEEAGKHLQEETKEKSIDRSFSSHWTPDPEIMPFERIAFLGAGNMAFAIAQGLVRSGRINPSKQFYVYAPSKRNLPKFEQAFTCTTTTDIHSLESVRSSDLVFVCVKPNCLNEPLIRFTQDPLIISVAAGVSMEKLKQSVIAPNGQYVRIMTNTACAIGASVCATHIDPVVEDRDLSLLKPKLTQLLSPLGEVHFVDEAHLNTITAVAGSGPAFALTFIQAMADGGVKMGLPRQLALRLAALTLSGASSLVLQSSNEHPIALRDKVCSPAGTTIHGIHALERSGFYAGVMDAVEAASLRAAGLSSK